jgi:hypothetical protein
VRRLVLVASVLVALTGSLVACKSETPGLPSASSSAATTSKGGGGPFSETNTASESTPNSSAAPGPLANMAACSLLTSADVSALGVTSAGTEFDASKTSRSCQYLKSGSFTISAAIFDDHGIQDVTGRGTLTSLTIGSHEAVQGMSGGLCAIAIKTSENSRVDATGQTNADQKASCDLAHQVAEILEKKLPK